MLCLEQISQASSRSPQLPCSIQLIILKLVYCPERMSFLHQNPTENSFISYLLFAPSVNHWCSSRSWIFGELDDLTLKGRLTGGQDDGDKEELMPPVAQTSGENLFTSPGYTEAVSAVRFSLWLRSALAVILSPQLETCMLFSPNPAGQMSVLINFAEEMCFGFSPLQWDLVV